MTKHDERDFAGGGAHRDERGAKPRFTRTFAGFLVLWLGMLAIAFLLFGLILRVLA